MILDACRNNPFLKNMSRAVASRTVSRGLAEVEPGGHTLVAFAAKEGTVALDGQGRNSPYATALIEVLKQPGVEINFVFRHVHDRVVQATAGLQQPHVYGALSAKEIFIHPPQSDPEPAADRLPRRALELALWDAATADNSADSYRDYLDRFPDGTFATFARRRIAALERPPGETTPSHNPQPAQPTTTTESCPPLTGAWSLQHVGARDVLFVRLGPSQNSRAVGALPFNATGVETFECAQSGYCRIQYGCIQGYAHGQYLIRANHAGPNTNLEEVYSVVDLPEGETLNLRAGPGSAYEIVAELPPTASGIAVIDCQATSNYRFRWCAAEWHGRSGWAYGRYLSDRSGKRPVR